MSRQVHRMFYHYSEYPLSLRVLYTGTLIVLGVGYLFAMLHLFNSHAWRDGNPGLSAKDIMIAYSGQDTPKLVTALQGPMSEFVEPEIAGAIISWVEGGASVDVYEEKIQGVIEENCLGCHDGSNPHTVKLAGFDAISKLTKLDKGEDIFSLVRVSHIHLFGITFIFFIMGLIFSHAFFRPVWLKSTIISIPFAAIIIDIGSWFLTKIYMPFAWVVMLGGALMGLSFAFMWVTSFYQIWFMKLPKDLTRLPPGVTEERRRKVEDLG